MTAAPALGEDRLLTLAVYLGLQESRGMTGPSILRDGGMVMV